MHGADGSRFMPEVPGQISALLWLILKFTYFIQVRSGVKPNEKQI